MALRGTMSRSPSYNGASFKDLHADRGGGLSGNFTTPFSLVVSQPSIFCSCTMYDIAIIDVVEGKEPPPTPVSVPPAPEPALQPPPILHQDASPTISELLAMQQASRLSASNVAAQAATMSLATWPQHTASSSSSTMPPPLMAVHTPIRVTTTLPVTLPVAPLNSDIATTRMSTINKLRQRLTTNFSISLPSSPPYPGTTLITWLNSVLLVMRSYPTVPAAEFLDVLFTMIPGDTGSELRLLDQGIYGTFANLFSKVVPDLRVVHSDLNKIKMTQSTIREFKQYLFNFWTNLRLAEAVTFDTALGVGRLYDGEKLCVQYALEHPDFDPLEITITDFISELKLFANYVPTSSLQQEFVDQIRSALFAANASRFLVRIERMDPKTNPLLILNDMDTWDKLQPYVVQPISMPASAIDSLHSSSQSSQRSVRRPFTRSSQSYAASNSSRNSSVPIWATNPDFWPKSMNRDPSRHTHRYHSEFMNYLWDKNEGHQTASQLSSGSLFFCECRSCLDTWAQAMKLYRLPPEGGPMLPSIIATTFEARTEHKPLTIHHLNASSSASAHPEFPDRERESWRGGWRGRNEHFRGRGYARGRGNSSPKPHPGLSPA